MFCECCLAIARVLPAILEVVQGAGPADGSAGPWRGSGDWRQRDATGGCDREIPRGVRA